MTHSKTLEEGIIHIEEASEFGYRQFILVIKKIFPCFLKDE